MQNQGCVRPINVKMRKGSILDPIRPAAVAARHHTQQALADVILKALAPLRPEVSAAGCQVSFSSFFLGGFDDRSEVATDGEAPYYVICDIVGGGMGGGPRTDGLTAVDTHGGNCSILSAEVLETIGPMRVLRSVLVPDSCGVGKHRGGLGILRDFEMLGERGVLTCVSQQQRDDTALFSETLSKIRRTFPNTARTLFFGRSGWSDLQCVAVVPVSAVDQAPRKWPPSLPMMASGDGTSLTCPAE